MKSSLRSDEIAAAMGGFNFVRDSGFHLYSRSHPCESKDFIIYNALEVIAVAENKLAEFRQNLQLKY